VPRARQELTSLVLGLKTSPPGGQWGREKTQGQVCFCHQLVKLVTLSDLLKLDFSTQ